MKTKELLELCREQSLRNHADHLCLPNAFDMDQEALIEALYSQLLRPEIMRSRLIFMPDDHMALFEQACVEPTTCVPAIDGDALQDQLKRVIRLNNSCYIFFTENVMDVPIPSNLEQPDGTLRITEDVLNAVVQVAVKMYDTPFVVPEELADLYAEINTPEFQRQRQIGGQLFQTLTVCDQLYGFVPVTTLHRVFTNAIDPEVTEEEVRELLRVWLLTKSDWTYHSAEDCLIRVSLSEDPEALKAVLERWNNCAMEEYLPTKQEISTFFDKEYPADTPAYEKYCSFLVDYCNVSMFDANSNARSLWAKILEDDEKKNPNGFQEELQLMMDQARGNPSILKLLTQLLVQCQNATRLPRLRGHMASEDKGAGYVDSGAELLPGGLQKRSVRISFLKGPLHKIQIGRNDPCPCGSGKKYKKCCG